MKKKKPLSSEIVILSLSKDQPLAISTIQDKYESL